MVAPINAESGVRGVDASADEGVTSADDVSSSSLVSGGGGASLLHCDFDSLSPDQVRVQAHKLAQRYKLLLKECDAELALVKELRSRVKGLEAEKVSFSSKYTDEICELLSENTVLKSRLEREEATKHDSHYHSVSHIQSLNKDIQSQQQQIANLKATLEQVRAELGAEVSTKKELQRELERVKRQSGETNSSLENKVQCLLDENRAAATEKDALYQKAQHQESLLESLEKQVSELRKTNEAVEKDWKHTKEELDTYVTCSDEKRAELLSRIEDLENELAQERNEKKRANEKTEKVTNQLTDLIRTYENIKHDNNQLREEVQRMKDDKRKLEAALNGAKIESDDLKAQLADYEQNFQSIRVELEQALKRQKAFESTYSDSFKTLESVLFQHTGQSSSSRGQRSTGNVSAGGRRTQERADARNKQGKLASSEHPTKEKSEGRWDEGGRELEPSMLVDSVTSMLHHYNSQLETSRAESAALVDRLKSVGSEVDSYKEAVEHSKRVLDELKEQLASKSHQLATVKREKCELEQRSASAQQQVQTLGEESDKQRNRADKLSDQMLIFKKKQKLQDETRKKQLLYLSEKLQSMRVLERAVGGGGVQTQTQTVETDERKVSEFSEWDLVYDSVAAQLDIASKQHRTLSKKIDELQFACGRKDEAIDEMSSSHEAQVASLKAQLAHSAQTQNNQRAQLEQHYTHLVQELSEKLKDGDQWNVELNDKIAVLENLRTSQEIETGELKELLLKSQNNAQSFQLALCLVSSCLWPLFDRMKSLISQQNMLSHFFYESQQTQKHLAKLVSVLSSQMSPALTQQPEDEDLKGFQGVAIRLAPILKFRRCVIAVLAANRLITMFNQSSLCFTLDRHLTGGPNARLSLFLGSTSSNSATSVTSANSRNNLQESKGNNKKPHNQRGSKLKRSSSRRSPDKDYPVLTLIDQKEKIQQQQLAMMHWLTDSGFPYKVSTSVSELLSFVQNCSLQDSPEEGVVGNQRQLKGILTQSRNSFVQLVSRVSHHFEQFSPLSDGSSAATITDRPSLAQRLLKGLHATMMRMTPSQRAVYVPSQHHVGVVHSRVVDLCERISGWEEERENMGRELVELRSEVGHLCSVRDRANLLQQQINSLKQQSESMVSGEKYNKVCVELDSCLLREKQAEELLREQGQQLFTLGHQLEHRHREESSREASLADTNKELCEVKLELSKKTHELRGLSRRVEELQLERSRLQQSVATADLSARCAEREGDMVECYVRAVNSAVDNFKQMLIYSPSTVNTLVLPQLEEVIAGNAKLSNELKVCHELVNNFGETLGYLTSHLHNQSTQIRSQKENIATLKQELLASTKPPVYLNNVYNPKQIRSSSYLNSGTPDSGYAFSNSGLFHSTAGGGGGGAGSAVGLHSGSQQLLYSSHSESSTPVPTPLPLPLSHAHNQPNPASVTPTKRSSAPESKGSKKSPHSSSVPIRSSSGNQRSTQKTNAQSGSHVKSR